jgi:hypothetical protein
VSDDAWQRVIAQGMYNAILFESEKSRCAPIHRIHITLSLVTSFCLQSLRNTFQVEKLFSVNTTVQQNTLQRPHSISKRLWKCLQRLDQETKTLMM